MQKLVHPDVQFIFPTAPTQQIKAPTSSSFLKPWRQLVQEHPYASASRWSHHLGIENKQLNIPREEARQILQAVSIKAFSGGHKIVLLWLPEYLHPTAANALLKVLEEPPPQTLFLLVSHQHEKLLGTIRSRVQQVYVPAWADEDLAHLLSHQYNVSSAQLAPAVLLADGDVNRALQLAGEAEAPHFEQFKAWMRLCYQRRFSPLLAQAEAFRQQPKAAQKNFVRYALHLLREALVAPLSTSRLSRATAAEQAFCERLRKTLTHQQIKAYTHWLNEAHYHLERNANPKLLYADLSLKVAKTF